MRSVLDRLLHPRRRDHTPVLSSSTRATTNSVARHDEAQRQLARSLAEALDDALRNRRIHQLRAIAESALRIAHQHPQLTERLARMRLGDGDAEGALDLIDASIEQTASLRLLRNVCLVQVGRRAEAHHDLARWVDEAPVPMDARLMLALLDWEAGNCDDAVAHLRDNLRQFENGDERTLTLLMCLAIERGRADQATTWAQQLRRCTWQRPTTGNVELIIASLNLPGWSAVQPTEQQLDTLAMELIAAEPAIGAMVDALELEPDKAATELLAVGLERALPDLSDETRAIEALARLHVQLGRSVQALHWINLGLQRSPMSASLILLKRQLDPPADRQPGATIESESPAPLPLTSPARDHTDDDTRSRAA